jgi:hypothetical protein
MSKIRSTAAAVSTAFLATLLVPAVGPGAAATETPSGGLTPEDIQACVAPLATRNPDVLQGWIDGCRQDWANRTAVVLGNKI